MKILDFILIGSLIWLSVETYKMKEVVTDCDTIIEGVASEFEELKSSIDELKSEINDLESKIDDLEFQISIK